MASPSRKPLLSLTSTTLMVDALRSLSYWSFRAQQGMIEEGVVHILTDQFKDVVRKTPSLAGCGLVSCGQDATRNDPNGNKTETEFSMLGNPKSGLLTIEDCFSRFTPNQKEAFLLDLNSILVRAYQTPAVVSMPARILENWVRKKTLKKKEGDWAWVNIIINENDGLDWCDDGKAGYSQSLVEVEIGRAKLQF